MQVLFNRHVALGVYMKLTVEAETGLHDAIRSGNQLCLCILFLKLDNVVEHYFRDN